MLVCTVPASKNTCFVCTQPGTHVFVDLHANENPSRAVHERTVHTRASLGTRYMPASMSNTQVTRVRAGKKSYTQVCLPLSTGTLWYPRGINHRTMVYISTCYNLSYVSLASSLFLKRSQHHGYSY